MAFAALLSLTAQAPAPAAPMTAQGVIDRMVALNANLATYTARVHVLARPSIPLCRLKVEGTAYYKRPGNFAVVLNPASGLCAGSLKSIQTLSTDIGNPQGWARDWNIALSGVQQNDEKPLIVLVLTKKVHSDELADTLVYVDPQSYEIVQMVWHYTNGDAITMTQSYTDLGAFRVVAHQHFQGRRDHIAFTGDSTYDSYQTNVAVNDAVFQRQQQ